MEENAMTRREARESAFLAAFSATFQPEEPLEAIRDCGEMQEVAQDAFTTQLLHVMNRHAAEIDETISAHLKGWTLSRLPRVSLTAMRLALAEMLYGTPLPDIIKERIEKELSMVREQGTASLFMITQLQVEHSDNRMRRGFHREQYHHFNYTKQRL